MGKKFIFICPRFTHVYVARLLLFLCCLCFALSAISVQAQGTWWMFHHDPLHTGLSPFAGPNSTVNTWVFHGGQSKSSPALGTDSTGHTTIYVGSDDDYLSAIDSTTHQLVPNWPYLTGGAIESSPAVWKNNTSGKTTVYVGSDDHYLYALDSSGTPIPNWPYLTGGAVESSPAVSTNSITGKTTIYVGSDDGYLYAIDSITAQSVSTNWPYQTYGAIKSSPAIGANGTIYVGSDDGYLYALNPDGTPVPGFWPHQTGGAIETSPAIGADGTIYVGADDGYFYAITANGSLQYQLYIGAAIKSSPAIGANSTIYFGADNDILYAVGPDGTIKWEFITGNAIVSSPAIDANGIIYVGSLDSNMYAIYPTGMLEWQYNIGDAVYSSPAIGADGTLYVGDTLYAIGPGGQLAANVIIANVKTTIAATVQVPVTLTAQGDENTLGGTIAFDPTVLGNPQVSLGTDDPTADWMVNSSQAANGLIAFAVALPAGQTFAACTQQVAVLTFDLLDTSFIGPTPVTFTNQPMPCELVDVNANDLNATWQNGSVTIDHAPMAANASYTINENTTLTTTAATGVLANAGDVDGNALSAVLITSPSYGTLTFYADGSFTYVPKLCFVTTDTFTYQAYDGMAYSNTATVTITVNALGYEGDVAPRPYGNGVVNLADWVQEGRYVAGLDTIPSYPNSIFMAADCAPLSTKGDGQLTVADWVQVGRFALGLDPLTTIGGPDHDPPLADGTRAMSPSRLLAGKTARALSIDAATLTRGKAGVVAVTLNALGNESALGFSVRFDAKCLKFVSAKVVGATAAATLLVNANVASAGNLGVALMLPLPTTCKAGKGAVVELTFLPLAAGATPLTFSDQVVSCEIAGATAAALPATFVNGTVLVRQ